MYNISANNNAYIGCTTSENDVAANSQKHRFKTNHTFQDRDTKRKYHWMQFTNERSEIFQLVVGEIYVLTGLLNVVGYNYFLVLQKFKVDDKKRLIGRSGSNAKNPIDEPINSTNTPKTE